MTRRLHRFLIEYKEGVLPGGDDKLPPLILGDYRLAYNTSYAEMPDIGHDPNPTFQCVEAFLVGGVIPPQCSFQEEVYSWKLSSRRMAAFFTAFETYRVFRKEHLKLGDETDVAARKSFRDRLNDKQKKYYDQWNKELVNLRIPALKQRHFSNSGGNSQLIPERFRRIDSPTSERANGVRRDLTRDRDQEVGPSVEPDDSESWRDSTREAQRAEADARAASEERRAHSPAPPREASQITDRQLQLRPPRDETPEEDPAHKRRRIALQNKRPHPAVCEARPMKNGNIVSNSTFLQTSRPK